jgi:hypothetical protein
MAFHEKAGRSQVGSFAFSLDKVILPPSRRHCRHPSIRTLDERFCSLSASWVFSFQPVLPPDYRPLFPSRDGSWTRWDEKAGLRRDAVRSQVIDALEAQEIKETGNEEG